MNVETKSVLHCAAETNFDARRTFVERRETFSEICTYNTLQVPGNILIARYRPTGKNDIAKSVFQPALQPEYSLKIPPGSVQQLKESF